MGAAGENKRAVIERRGIRQPDGHTTAECDPGDRRPTGAVGRVERDRLAGRGIPVQLQRSRGPPRNRPAGTQVAPELAKLLAQGHENRKQGWIQVYRPMYIMTGMGLALKVAVPEISKALSDQHFINVNQAAVLLAEIGPDAKSALPELKKAWDTVEASNDDAGRKLKMKNVLAKAMIAIDAEAAKQAGVAVVTPEE